MLDICYYYNQVPMENEVCNDCPEFMATCYPMVDSIDGYSSISECSCSLCEGCVQVICLFKSMVNL